MRKQITKYGNTLVMRFNAEDQEVHDISEGDIFEVQLIKIDRKEVKKK